MSLLVVTQAEAERRRTQAEMAKLESTVPLDEETILIQIFSVGRGMLLLSNSKEKTLFSENKAKLLQQLNISRTPHDNDIKATFAWV